MMLSNLCNDKLINLLGFSKLGFSKFGVFVLKLYVQFNCWFMK